MREEKLEKLLNELADATAEPVPPHLAEDIKHQIPQQLSPHRGGLDTVNIIVDLRISKLTAAAAIIVTMVLFANFFGGQSPADGGIYQNGKLLVKYCLGGILADRSNVLAAKSRYEYLAQTGKDVMYYGDSVDPRDSNAVLIQWKLSDGGYRVVFGDLREEIVSAEELIRLQARMLQKKAK
ncbi:MAG: hypothetical protein ABSG99_03430 [Sedimentisphaerales bacterium]